LGTYFGTKNGKWVGMKHKILVIEDDAPLCYILGRILGEKFDVTVQTNALSAMAWLSQGNLPDLILTDFDLPDVSGLDFVRNLHISGAYNRIPLIMLSGNSNKKIINECLAAGASDFIQKPFDPPQLISSINKVLVNKEIYV